MGVVVGALGLCACGGHTGGDGGGGKVGVTTTAAGGTQNGAGGSGASSTTATATQNASTTNTSGSSSGSADSSASSSGGAGGSSGPDGASTSQGAGGGGVGSGGANMDSTTASSGGAGGGGGADDKCSSREDCVLFSDCCTCRALTSARKAPECDLFCIQDSCSAAGITEEDVACVAGRCVLDRSCDDSNVTCEVATPNCEPASAPEVVDDCYTGRCLPVDQCSRVASCDACEAGGFACAVYATQVGVQNHCVSVLEACDANDCECMGVCTAPFSCGSDLSCSCPVC